MRSPDSTHYPQGDSPFSPSGMRDDAGRATRPTSSPDLNAVPLGSRLSCDTAMWSALHAHLLRDGLEQAAIVYAMAARSSCAVQLKAIRVELLQATDFEFQSAVHIALTDDAQQRIIKTAWDLGAAVVEFHSHVNPRYAAEFSASDRAGFADFVPHVWWRLQGQPYAAVVVAPGSIDALVWRDDPRSPEPLAGIDVHAPQDGRNPDGETTVIPTGLTYELLSRCGRDADAMRTQMPAKTDGQSPTASQCEVSDD